MAEENIQGAAEKISGLLNPQQDNQEPETNTEPSESTPEKQEVQESQSKSNETPEQESENSAFQYGTKAQERGNESELSEKSGA